MVNVMPTFVASNVSEMAVAGTDMTVPLPPEVQPGDTMLVYVKNNGANTATPPAPPTPEWVYRGTTATGYYYHLFSKRYESGGNTEPTFLMGSSARHQAHVVVYRDVGSVSMATSASVGNGTATVNHSTLTPVKTIHDNSLVVHARDHSTSQASGSLAWTNAIERTDNSFNYASGLTNILSTAEVAVPTAGAVPVTVTTAVTGGVSNGTNRIMAVVLSPVTNYPRIIGITDISVDGDSITVPIPEATVPTDILIAFVVANRRASAVAAPELETPPGWSVWLTNTTTDGMRATVFYRYAPTNEPSFTFATTSATASINDAMVAIVYAVRNVALLNGIRMWADSNNITNLLMRDIPTTVDECLILKFYVDEDTGASNTATWPVSAEDLDVRNAGDFNYGSARGIQPVAGTHPAETITMSGNSTDTMTAVVALAPFPPVVIPPGSFWPFFG